MQEVLIKRFDGGIAQSERPETLNEQAASGGFDIFSDPFKLLRLATPNQLDQKANGTPTDLQLYDAIKRDTDGVIIGVGQTDSNTSGFKFYRKSGNLNTSTWQISSVSSAGNVATTGNAYVVLYKGIFYGAFQEASNTSLIPYTSDSVNGTQRQVGDFNAVFPRPVVHTQDNILYVAGGKTIAKWDGTTWTTPAITLPYNITSMCEYGTYLAIACQAPYGGVIYLWGRDTSLTTLQDVIQVDSGKLMIIENLAGILTSVSESPWDPNAGGGMLLNAAGLQKVIVRQYTGAQMQEIKSASYSTTNEGGQSQNLQNRRMKKDGHLYFSTNSDYLWRFGPNKNREYVLSQERRVAYTGRSISVNYNFFFLGDYLYSCQRTTSGSQTDGLLVRTDSFVTNNFGSSDISFYTTTINEGMPLADRFKDKTLKKVIIFVASDDETTGTIKVEVGVDTATLTTAINQTQPFTNGKGANTKYIKYEAVNNTDLTEFGSGKEIVVKATVTGRNNIVGILYGYELTDASLTEG